MVVAVTELSRETRERGLAEVAKIRARLHNRDETAEPAAVEPEDDEDSEPLDTWRERKDLQ